MPSLPLPVNLAQQISAGTAAESVTSTDEALYRLLAANHSNDHDFVYQPSKHVESYAPCRCHHDNSADDYSSDDASDRIYEHNDDG